MKINNVIQISNNSALSGKYNYEIGAFKSILEEKSKSTKSAKEFLATLSSAELHIIQEANNLACTINVNELSDEGAENLFNRPVGKSKLVDLNNDGIVEVGEAKTIVIPPLNAPDSVKEAWEQATSGLTLREKVLLEGKFLVKQIEANSYKDVYGNIKVRQPGESGWVNIFGETEEAFVSLLEELIYRIDNPLAWRDEKPKELDQLARDVFAKVISLLEL